MEDSEKTARLITVNFDSKVFSLMAVKKAAYRYIDLFSADIVAKDDEIRCVLKFSSERNDEGYSKLVDEFKKEVLDQDLREKLKAETESVRNLILAHTFSKTGIVSNEPVSPD
jgi:His-Xaa-Ser system protein HxsD